MSELSRTILAGTEQQQSALRDLTAIRAAKCQRKQAAIQSVVEAAQGLGQTLVDLRSMREAKAAETEERDILNAAALGAATKGPTGALIALDTVRPRTLPGARTLVRIQTDYEEKARRENDERLQNAQLFRLEQDERDRKKRQEQEDRELQAYAELVKTPLDPDADPQDRMGRAIAAAAPSLYKPSQLLSDEDARRQARRSAVRLETKQDAKTSRDRAAGEAFQAFYSEDPVLDREGGAYRPPTPQERLARAARVEGTHPEDVKSLERRAREMEEHARRRERDTALAGLRREFQAFDQADRLRRTELMERRINVRVDANARATADALLRDGRDLYAKLLKQRDDLQYDQTLTDEEREQRSDSLDRMLETTIAKHNELADELETAMRAGGPARGSAATQRHASGLTDEQVRLAETNGFRWDGEGWVR